MLSTIVFKKNTSGRVKKHFLDEETAYRENIYILYQPRFARNFARNSFNFRADYGTSVISGRGESFNVDRSCAGKITSLGAAS